MRKQGLTMVVWGCLMVLGLLVVLTGCSAAAQRALSLADDGATVNIAAGQTIVVRLESNPTTGYSWQVEPLAGGILGQVGESSFDASSKALGAGGVETWEFRALGKGTATLRLVYRRPWEKGIDPIKTFSCTVVVG